MGQALNSQGQSLHAYRRAATSLSAHKLDNWTLVGPCCMMGAGTQRDLGPHGLRVSEQQILIKEKKYIVKLLIGAYLFICKNSVCSRNHQIKQLYLMVI